MVERKKFLFEEFKAKQGDIMWEEISAHVYKHAKIMSRRPGEIAWILLYPFIGILSLGILAFFLMSKGAPLDSMVFVFVGVMVWNFYGISQRGITYGITFDIWNGCLRHSFTGKSSVRHFIIGNSIFGFLSSFAAFLIIGTVGIIFFGFNIFSAGIFLVNLFFVFMFATGIGLMINGLMVAYGEKYMSLIWMLTGIIMVFSGVYYPVSMLPGVVQAFSYAIPATHSIISIRAALGISLNGATASLAIGAALAFVYLAIGALVFRYAVKMGKRSGMITRY